MMSFTVCMKVCFGEFEASYGWPGFACSNPSSPQTHQKLTFIQLVCLIVELLVSYWGHCWTNSQKKGRNSQKRKASGTGRIATSFKENKDNNDGCISCQQHVAMQV